MKGSGDIVNGDTTEMFTSRAISSEDAIRILTAAYHVSVEEATALLPRNAEKCSEAITPGKF